MSPGVDRYTGPASAADFGERDDTFARGETLTAQVKHVAPLPSRRLQLYVVIEHAVMLCRSGVNLSPSMTLIAGERGARIEEDPDAPFIEMGLMEKLCD